LDIEHSTNVYIYNCLESHIQTATVAMHADGSGTGSSLRTFMGAQLHQNLSKHPVGFPM